MKKMLFFVNPAAGQEEMEDILMEVLSFFTASGFDVTCHPTQGPKEITEIIRDRGGEFDMIVASGGDGTLNETVTGLMGLTPPPTLGYIPAGTVNDFASSLHIPKALRAAVHNVVEGEPFAVDVGRFNDRYFTYVAAFGAFTKVSYETPHASKQALGRTAYILEGVKSLSSIKPIHVTLRTADTVIEDDVIFGMVTNATSVGGFKAISGTEVFLDDGLSEVILVRAVKNLAEFNLMLGAVIARDFGSKYFHTLQASDLTLHVSEPVSWTLDGEYGGTVAEAAIRNLPKAVHIMVPRKPR